MVNVIPDCEAIPFTVNVAFTDCCPFSLKHVGIVTGIVAELPVPSSVTVGSVSLQLLPLPKLSMITKGAFACLGLVVIFVIALVVFVTSQGFGCCCAITAKPCPEGVPVPVLVAVVVGVAVAPSGVGGIVAVGVAADEG